MRIADYKDFISKFPYLNQSFSVDRQTWDFSDQKENIDRIFDSKESIILRRNDLYNARFDTTDFIIKTLMWGYPRKGRGNNIKNIFKKDNFHCLVKMLETYRDTKVQMEQVEEDVKSIKGLGMSTMTKFTTFLNTKINGYQSVILDDKIMKVINESKFIELQNLKGIKDKNKTFIPYIKTLNTLAEDLNINPNQIELFLFVFGQNLSELE